MRPATLAHLSTIRKDNLRAALQLASSDEVFLSALQLSPSSVRAYLSPSARVPMGSILTGHIEKMLCVPIGCMDFERGLEQFHGAICERFGFTTGPHPSRVANLQYLLNAFGGERGAPQLAATIGITLDRLEHLLRPKMRGRMMIPEPDSAQIEDAFGFAAGDFDEAGAARLLLGRTRHRMPFLFQVPEKAQLPRVRLRWLKELVRLTGGTGKFAAATGCPMETLHTLLAPANLERPRDHRSEFFRTVESQLGLPRRCMDAVRWPADFEKATALRLREKPAAPIAAVKAAEPAPADFAKAFVAAPAVGVASPDATAAPQLGIVDFQRGLQAWERSASTPESAFRRPRARGPR